MKMKKLTIIASATLLASLLTLTSCSNSGADAEEIDFAKYSSEITLADYQKAHDKYAATVNVEDGYDFTKYSYASNTTSAKSGDTSSVTYEKQEGKYDKENAIVIDNQESYSFNNEVGDTKTASVNYQTQIQKNGDKSDYINVLTKTYSTYESDAKYYAYQSINLSNYVDTLTGSVSEDDTTKTVKYYGDNNVYTLTVTINTSDEHEESGIKFKETVSSETIFQFYVSDTEVYGKYTFERTITLEYTDGDQTGTVTKKTMNAKYATLKAAAITLSVIDTSTYQKSAY